jgi:hypothetical protein
MAVLTLRISAFPGISVSSREIPPQKKVWPLPAGFILEETISQ